MYMFKHVQKRNCTCLMYMFKHVPLLYMFDSKCTCLVYMFIIGLKLYVLETSSRLREIPAATRFITTQYYSKISKIIIPD